MKKTLIAVSGLGAVAGFVLRRIQLSRSFDAMGLLPQGDGITIALNVLCVLAVAVVLLLCLREPKCDVPVVSGRRKLQGILVIAAAVGLLSSNMPPQFDGDTVSIVVLVLAFAAACAMAVEGLFHMQGHVGSLLGGCALTVYLALTLINDYRVWSQDPLVTDYCFKLLFLLSGMLASYYLAAFRVGRGKRRTTAFYTACALIFAGPVLADGGLMSVLHTIALSLYLAAEFWPFLDRPEQPEAEPEEN